jgi:hypothetical protein
MPTPDATDNLRKRLRKLQKDKGLSSESGRRALAAVLEQETPAADRELEFRERALEASANKVHHVCRPTSCLPQHSVPHRVSWFTAYPHAPRSHLSSHARSGSIWQTGWLICCSSRAPE